MAANRRSAITPPAKKTSAKPNDSPNLEFPTRTFHKILEEHSPSGLVEEEAALLLSAVLEYLTAEIMERTVNAARIRIGLECDETVQVKVEDMQTAIGSDPDLKKLMNKLRRVSQ